MKANCRDKWFIDHFNYFLYCVYVNMYTSLAVFPLTTVIQWNMYETQHFSSMKQPIDTHEQSIHMASHIHHVIHKDYITMT